MLTDVSQWRSSLRLRLLPRGRRRRRLFAAGLVLLAVGWVPLFAYCLWESLAGDPENPGYPVGLGCWGTLVSGLGFLLSLIALSLGPPREGDPARTQSNA